MSILELFNKYGTCCLILQILSPLSDKWLDYASIKDYQDVRLVNRLILATPFKFRLIHVRTQEVMV